MGGEKQLHSSQNQNQISFQSRSNTNTPSMFSPEGHRPHWKAEVYFPQVNDRMFPGLALTMLWDDSTDVSGNLER